jgi:hypothetical protein
MPRTPISDFRSGSTHAAPAQRVVARLLWQWLTVGVLLTLLFPAARGSSTLLGPMFFWLLGVPSISLIVFHRHALAAAWLGVLVSTPGRRRARRVSLPAPRPAFTARSAPARRRAA